MSSWRFAYDGFEPEKEGLREALCTLGNGYFATRGAFAGSEASDTHYPGTYLAGGYNRLKTGISGRTIENEDLVNFPNWTLLKFRFPGEDWFSLTDVAILHYRQELDMRKGILSRDIRFEDSHGRITRLESRRIVHMAYPHLAAQETTLTAENWSGTVEFLSALDGTVINYGVERYRDLNMVHLEPMEEKELDEERILLKVRTSQSRLEIAEAARTLVYVDGVQQTTEKTIIRKPGFIGQLFGVSLKKGGRARLEKTVSLFTSRDRAISECSLEASSALSGKTTFEHILESHVSSWDRLWRRFEMDFYPGDKNRGDRTARILHLYTLHLLQTASMHTMDLDVGIPSRGWHGEAYRGHIFWDEIYIFPLLNLRMPEITRSLLMYRYRRLDAARNAANNAGHLGAMYPWQSGSNGREETQELHLNPKSGRWNPDNSHLQRHVNVAIAYNIWQYYQVTGDLEFMSFHGAEMSLEIARFLASLATWNEQKGRYEILGVMGPDEYHDGYPDSDKPGLNNNAYTNIMTVWVLNRALELKKILSGTEYEQIMEKTGLDEDETDHWKDITAKMFIPFHGKGIISQFEGYEDLEEFDWEGYRKKYGDIQRLDRILKAEDDTPNRYKASKQADVLMLFYLFSSEQLQEIFRQLGYDFPYETIPDNIEYYLRRTSHGSTLSRVVHSWVMARANRQRSWELFAEALESDVADIQGGTTPEGIHLGAMAGTADILQRGYTGLVTRGDMLHVNPVIPEELGRLHMHIRYRGHALSMDITSTSLTIKDYPTTAGPVRICFKDQIFEIPAGGDHLLTLKLEN
jgi:alpha,alpha-trehalase